MADTNDRLGWLGVLAQGVILAMLVYVGWTVREIRRNPQGSSMSLTTEWHTSGGRTETLTSYRARGETFLEFNLQHNEAVADMGGPQR